MTIDPGYDDLFCDDAFQVSVIRVKALKAFASLAFWIDNFIV